MNSSSSVVHFFLTISQNLGDSFRRQDPNANVSRAPGGLSIDRLPSDLFLTFSYHRIPPSVLCKAAMLEGLYAP